MVILMIEKAINKNIYESDINVHKIERFYIPTNFIYEFSKIPSENINCIYEIDEYNNIIDTIYRVDKNNIINFVLTNDGMLHFNPRIFKYNVSNVKSSTPLTGTKYLLHYYINNSKIVNVYDNASEFEILVHNVYNNVIEDIPNIGGIFNIIKIIKDEYVKFKSWDDNIQI